jgi:CubicO group peptidase (beta-lactamase class C family)
MRKALLSLVLLIYSVLNTQAQETEKHIDALIGKAVQLNRFNGSVLVSRKGHVVYEKAFGYQNADKKVPNTSNTIYQIGSTTKEFTAALILKLAEQHKLDIEDKLSKYFPDYKYADQINIRQLLTHTSGIYEFLRDPEVAKGSAEPKSKEKLLTYFMDKPLDFTPGSQFSYSNSGYVLLGLIIEQVTGKSYQTVVRESILKPLKMNHTGFDFLHLKSPDKAMGYSKYNQKTKVEAIPWDSTATFSAGSMYSTVSDLQRWNEGLVKYKVLSKSSLEKATTPYLSGYGLGCWIDTLNNKKIVSHGGNIFGFTSYFGGIQDEDVCVILLTNIFSNQIETLGQSIFAILDDKPYAYFDELDLHAEELEKYVGEYEINPDYHINISLSDKQLFMSRNGEAASGIFPYKPDTFFEKDDDIRVAFTKVDGQITKISVTEGLNTKRGDKIKTP